MMDSSHAGRPQHAPLDPRTSQCYTFTNNPRFWCKMKLKDLENASNRSENAPFCGTDETPFPHEDATPTKKPPAVPDHPTKAEVDARVRVVYKLLLKGWDTDDIVEYCGKPASLDTKTGKTWTVKRAASYKYVAKAREMLCAEFKESTEQMRNQCARELQESYKVAAQSKSSSGMQAAVKLKAELFGLAAPVKVQHSGDANNPIAFEVDGARARLRARATAKELPDQNPA